MTDSTPKQIPPYGIRIPADLKERMKAAAEAAGRSLHAEVIHTLEEKYPALDEEVERIVKMIGQTTTLMKSAKSERERSVWKQVLDRLEGEMERVIVNGSVDS